MINQQAQMYGSYPDMPGFFQEEDMEDNTGYAARRRLFGGIKAGTESTFEYHGKPVSCYSKVYTPFTSSSLPLVSGVGVKLDMYLADPEFYLFSKQANAKERGFKLVIDSAVLLVQCKESIFF